MTLWFGPDQARLIGDAHEVDYSKKDTLIDQFNNRQARKLSQELIDKGVSPTDRSKIAEAVRQGLQQGIFIIDPNDPRLENWWKDE